MSVEELGRELEPYGEVRFDAGVRLSEFDLPRASGAAGQKSNSPWLAIAVGLLLGAAILTALWFALR